MKFIKLTVRPDSPMFIRPELIVAFGPSESIPPRNPPDHHSWIRIQGVRHELFVMETCEQLAKLLDVTL
jgi:hypothetical protein